MMKLLLLNAVLIAATIFQIGSNGDFNKKECSCKGKKLYGTVKVVDNFADFKVQVVNGLEDISVKKTGYIPSQCGEWKFTEGFADFTIQYVDAFPDFTIKFY
jgi:hypothetical protein